MNNQWIKICGEHNPEIEKHLTDEVEEKINCRNYTKDGNLSISTRPLEIQNLQASLSDNTLDKYRRLCQLWDVELYPFKIESHRKFIGPVIVFGKKVVFRVIKVLLKDFIEQQREFNATVVSTMIQSEKKQS